MNKFIITIFTIFFSIASGAASAADGMVTQKKESRIEKDGMKKPMAENIYHGA